MTERNYLALDLGAESGRAILGTITDGKLTLAETHRFPNGPVCTPDGLHWDVLRLWSEIQTGIAASADGKDFAWLSSGTWSILGVEADSPCLDERALAYNFTNEGGVNGTWRLSKNIMGLWLVQECKREWDLSYAEITQLAAEARPFLAIIDPDAAVFLHPGNMPEKIQKICAESGQPVPQTRGEIVRVALESLALKYRFVLERLETLTSKHLAPLHILGGGTKNRLLNQLAADCLGRAVVTGPVEATAIGNILMQAIALGHLGSLAEARTLVHNSFEVETFQPGDHSGWDESYQKLLSLTQSS